MLFHSVLWVTFPNTVPGLPLQSQVFLWRGTLSKRCVFLGLCHQLAVCLTTALTLSAIPQFLNGIFKDVPAPLEGSCVTERACGRGVKAQGVLVPAVGKTGGRC